MASGQPAPADCLICMGPRSPVTWTVGQVCEPGSSPPGDDVKALDPSKQEAWAQTGHGQSFGYGLGTRPLTLTLLRNSSPGALGNALPSPPSLPHPNQTLAFMTIQWLPPTLSGPVEPFRCLPGRPRDLWASTYIRRALVVKENFFFQEKLLKYCSHVCERCSSRLTVL